MVGARAAKHAAIGKGNCPDYFQGLLQAENVGFEVHSLQRVSGVCLCLS